MLRKGSSIRLLIPIEIPVPKTYEIVEEAYLYVGFSKS